MLLTILNLTTEQEFRLAQIRLNVERLDLENARFLVAELTRQMMVKDNFIKQILKCD